MRPRDAYDAAGPPVRLHELTARGPPVRSSVRAYYPRRRGPPGDAFRAGAFPGTDPRKNAESYDIYLVSRGALSDGTPSDASRGRRRRRQHRRGHVPQQVAVALDVGPQARVLALLLVEPHAQPIALIN